MQHVRFNDIEIRKVTLFLHRNQQGQVEEMVWKNWLILRRWILVQWLRYVHPDPIFQFEVVILDLPVSRQRDKVGFRIEWLQHTFVLLGVYQLETKHFLWTWMRHRFEFHSSNILQMCIHDLEEILQRILHFHNHLNLYLKSEIQWPKYIPK